MAQSTDSSLGNSRLLAKPYCKESPAQWTNWIDQLLLPIIAKENLGIDILKEPVESVTEILIIEGAQDSETETQRKARDAKNKEVMCVYGNAEDKRITDEKIKVRGDAKKRSGQESKMHPVAEGKTVFSQKQPNLEV